MEENILRTALRNSEAAEVYSESSTITSVSFQANRCQAVDTKLTNGVGLRMIKEGKLGFSSATALEQTDELVRAAASTAQFGEPARFFFPGPQELPKPKTLSNRCVLLPVGRMVRTGEDIIKLCTAQVPGLKIDLTLQKASTLIRLINSEGANTSYDRTTAYLSFEGLLIVDGSFIWIYDFLNLSRDFHFSVETFVARLVKLADQARKPASLKSGKYPCIFVQGAGIDLLQTLLPAVNGKMMQKGISPLIGKENQPLFDEKLSVIDDATSDFGFESGPIDGEGMPRHRLPIIEHGVFRNFLFDLKTAAAAGRESTGSAARSYRTMPTPGISNLIIEPGEMKLGQAIAGIKQGLLIYGAVGGGQSNLLAGDFSVNISLGYKIENGEVVGRVKDAMVAGNIYEIGRNIAGLGDTLYDFGNIVLPFMMFPELTVAARE